MHAMSRSMSKAHRPMSMLGLVIDWQTANLRYVAKRLVCNANKASGSRGLEYGLPLGAIK